MNIGEEVEVVEIRPESLPEMEPDPDEVPETVEVVSPELVPA